MSDTVSLQPGAPGLLVELRVDRVAAEGVCVARHDGRVVFVSDTIPGEVVRAQIVDDRHDRFWRATTVDVVEASPDRREHPWAEAGLAHPPQARAGGAAFGHIRATRQRALKAEVIAEALARFAGIDGAAGAGGVVDTSAGTPDAPGGSPADVPGTSARRLTVEPVPAPGVDLAHGTGWRTRVRLHVDRDGQVGPLAVRSHRVVPVRSLPLAVPSLQSLAVSDRVRGAGPTPRASRGRGGGGHRLGTLDLVASSDGTVLQLPGAARTPGVVTEFVGGRRFRVAANGFWQVHRGAAATLTGALADLVDPALLDPDAANCDLYGGVGMFAAALGDLGGADLRLTLVEADATATRNAEHNLAEWPRMSVVAASVLDALTTMRRRADARERAAFRRATVVLDPPRAGVGRDVVAALADLRPAQILAVSCDPVTFARDCGWLQDAGYRMAAVRAFDCFPNTHHCELMARFTAAE